MRADRHRLFGPGVMLILAIATPVGLLAAETAAPEPELLEFLALFAEADDEALELALGSVEDERYAGLRQTGRSDAAREDDDETR